MGRFVKNTELRTGAYSIRLPYGPGSVGPEGPVDGLIKYNSSIDKIQYYSQGAWRNIAVGGRAELIKDSFVADGVNREFGPLSKTYSIGDELYVLVFVGNVFQNPGVAYQVDNDMIRFTGTPGNGQPIIIIHGLGSTETI